MQIFISPTLVAHFRATLRPGETTIEKRRRKKMKRIDMLDAIAKMLVHLSDENLKTVYEFVLTISK